MGLRKSVSRERRADEDRQRHDARLAIDDLGLGLAGLEPCDRDVDLPSRTSSTRSSKSSRTESVTITSVEVTSSLEPISVGRRGSCDGEAFLCHPTREVDHGCGEQGRWLAGSG